MTALRIQRFLYYGLITMALCGVFALLGRFQTTPGADPTPSPTAGMTYYLSTTGDDSGPGSKEAPFRTFAKAVTVLTPGDTLLVYPGTYHEGLADIIPSGTADAPITIKAFYPERRPILFPVGGGDYPASDYVLFFTGDTGEIHHVIVDGFVLDGTNIARDVVKLEDGAHHIRLLNLELKNGPEHGLLITGGDSQYNEFSGLDIHNVGSNDFNHGVYISTSNNVFENSRVHNNAGWGIQVFNEHSWPCDNNIIRNNDVYNNARIGERGAGIGLYSGSGHAAYNNVVWGNNEGIVSDYNAVSPRIFNNTVYKNDRNGGQSNIYIGSETIDVQVYNNIIAGQPETGLHSSSSTPITARNNLFFGNGQAVLDKVGTLSMVDNIVGDPRFVDANSGNMHLRADSAAIDQGTVAGEPLIDKDGIAPQNNRRDIGAYEYHAG